MPLSTIRSNLSEIPLRAAHQRYDKKVSFTQFENENKSDNQQMDAVDPPPIIPPPHFHETTEQ